MQSNFQTSLDKVLLHEGGYVDHPDDPGGATNKGITLKVFQNYFGENLGKDELRNLTVDQAARIYKGEYWHKCHCGDLPSGIDYVVFDQAVNSGPSRSAKWLQLAINTDVDGAIGPNTISAASSANSSVTIESMCSQRMDFLRSLTTWSSFGRGWERRVDEVQADGLALAETGIMPSQATQQTLTADRAILREGASGDDVVALQEALNKHGVTPSLVVDGDFGAGTKKAIIAFQRAQALSADGIVGQKTQEALGL